MGGFLMAQEDLPFTSDGRVPDILFEQQPLTMGESDGEWLVVTTPTEFQVSRPPRWVGRAPTHGGGRDTRRMTIGQMWGFCPFAGRECTRCQQLTAKLCALIGMDTNLAHNGLPFTGMEDLRAVCGQLHASGFPRTRDGRGFPHLPCPHGPRTDVLRGHGRAVAPDDRRGVVRPQGMAWSSSAACTTNGCGTWSRFGTTGVPGCRGRQVPLPSGRSGQPVDETTHRGPPRDRRRRLSRTLGKKETAARCRPPVPAVVPNRVGCGSASHSPGGGRGVCPDGARLSHRPRRHGDHARTTAVQVRRLPPARVRGLRAGDVPQRTGLQRLRGHTRCGGSHGSLQFQFIGSGRRGPSGWPQLLLQEITAMGIDWRLDTGNH